MGNKCIPQSGKDFYKSVQHKKYLNETNPKSKYEILEKIYAQRKGVATLQVKDNTFGKIRIMKQVHLFFLTPV